MAFPSPWENPEFWQNVKLGGRLIKAPLVAIDGVEIEDEWQEQKASGTSGATNVFKGTKSPAAPTLTFEAVGEDDFADLREIWDLLAPRAGSGGNGTGAGASPGTAAYGKQFTKATSAASSTTPTGSSLDDLLAQAQSALAALQSGASSTSATSSGAGSSSSSSSTSATPNPGPKPPTLSIENGFVNYIGITAVSRKKWKGPYVTPTLSYRVDVTLVPQKEPARAAVGVAAPKSPDNPGVKTIAFGDIQGPAADASAVNSEIAGALG